MATYSTGQAREYRRVFEQFAASTGNVLHITDTYAALGCFGPGLTLEQVRQLIYKHDSSCTGLLDDEDFLSLLKEYQERIESERQALAHAFQRLEKRFGTPGSLLGSGLDKTTVARLLKTKLPVSDIQRCLGILMDHSAHNLTLDQLLTRSEYSPLGFISTGAPPASLHRVFERTISVRVMNARNLEYFAHTKVRKDRGIEYHSLDCVLVAEVAGQRSETNVLLGPLAPEWNHDFVLTVRNRFSSFRQLQRWLECEMIRFHLYDYSWDGVVPHSEWLGSAELPLSLALSTSQRMPISATMTLHCPTILSNRVPEKSPGEPLIDIVVHAKDDGTTEFFTTSVDADMIRCFTGKLAVDLPRAVVGMPPSRPADAAGLRSLHPLHQLVNEFVSEAVSQFPRRHFQVLALDNENQFRLLPGFIIPDMRSTSKDLDSLALLARSVARIPTHSSYPHETTTTTEVMRLQVQSPSQMLARNAGSLLEHAILLTSLLIDRGYDAYVCVGESQRMQRHAWVMVRGAEFPAACRIASPSGDRGKNYSREEKRQTSRQDANGLLAVSVAESSRNVLRYSRSRGASRTRSGLASQQHDGSAAGPVSWSFQQFRFAPFLARRRAQSESMQMIEAATGQVFSMNDGVDLPFARIGCVFNHINVWLNVQHSDLVHKVSWNLNIPGEWRPFMPDDRSLGRVRRVYDSPSRMLFPADCSKDDVLTKGITRSLVKGIQEYRRNQLYIPETLFDRDISLRLAAAVDQCEAAWYGDVSHDFISDVEHDISLQLPAHCDWHGRPFRFTTPDVHDVLQGLTWTGMLDCTVPGATFAIAARVVSHPWKLRTVWVYIGYVRDALYDH